ncbi:MAG TPA: FG-GAP repeat protein, partial [Methylomirabilota bacterium]|nr:FG-GAP repeat protein [Methylomirabilota bacterium]
MTFFPGTLLAAIPGELLGETKLSDVPGQGFGSAMLAVQGDTLVAKTNVYVRIGTDWVVQDQLAIVDPVTPSPIAVSVAIDVSEEILVVGSRDGDGGKGAAYVFVKEGSNWTQQTMLQPAEAGDGDMAGLEVAIEGEWIVVGAPEGTELSNQSTGPGSAYIFRNIGGTWTQVKRLVADDAAEGDWFGENLALSGDLIVIGAPGDTNAEGEDNGSAYVFERNAGGPDQWGQTAKLVPPKRTIVHRLHAGRAVDVSRDVVVLGSEEGSFVYRRQPNGTWVLEGDSLRHSSVDFLTQVNSIGLNDNADSFVAGDFQPDGQTGAAYLFNWTGSEWAEAALLEAGDGGGGRFFGWALDVSDETVAVNDSTGNVYVYAPDYADETLVTGYVRKSLYYEDADNSPSFPRSEAAFRYKTLLFAEDDADPERRVRARIEEIGSLYGADERARAQDAEDRVRLALEALPGSGAYGKLLLDIHYDRTAAEALFLKDALAKADLARLGPPSTPGGFVIDDEIGWYESALEICVNALQPYLSLLNNDLGHPQIEPPQGHQIFQSEVPGRALMPATYLDTGGDPHPVIEDGGPLF